MLIVTKEWTLLAMLLVQASLYSWHQTWILLRVDGSNSWAIVMLPVVACGNPALRLGLQDTVAPC